MNVRDLFVDRADACSTVYAVGDVHGRLDLLLKMEEAIHIDAALNGTGQAAICYLGDYIDRGPHSAGVVDYLCQPPDDGFERICLMGNHEDRLLDFLDEPVRHGPGWMRYGGREALESYGVTPRGGEELDWLRLHDEFANALPERHRAFLSKLHMGLFWRHYLLVHAGIDPTAPLDAQNPAYLLWVREPFLSYQEDWGVTVVHGHTIVDAPQFCGNRVGIDTGAYRTGLLTALAITDTDQRILQVRDG
jgi:serine/threonine protein phosphatase 1